MEMKKHKLGDIGEVRMCKRILKEETNTVSGIPFFKIGTFGDVADVFISRKKFEEYKAKYSYPKKGDVLISAAGTIGRTVVFNGEEAYFQDSNIVWIENDETKVVNALLYYAYKNVKWKVSNGSTILRLYNDDLRRTEIIVPADISVQKKIASVLSTLDKRIENLRAQNRVLEQTAKTIYDYTFLQCTGHQTTYNKTLNRNIPVGWEVSAIGCYIKESKGGDWGKENPEKNYNLQVSCIRGADIEKMTDLPIRYILAKNSSKLLQEFDLVVEISGGSPTQSTGRSRLMTKELLEMFDNKLICSNFCQAVTMKNPQYAYYISFMWKMFYDNGIFFNFEGKTSGIKNFQLDQFVDTMWFFPDLKTIERFNAQVAPLIKKQLFNAKQIEALTTQRNTLLPLLMTGQVTIK